MKKRVGTISVNTFIKIAGFFGCCTFYLFLRLREEFGFSWGLSFSVLLPLLSCFVLAPLAVHLTIRRGGRRRLTQAVFWAGYSWMGFLLLFVFVNASIDLVTLIMSTATAVAGPFTGVQFSGQHGTFLLSFLLTAILSVYALFEAGIPRSRKITLETEKLPPEMESLRIAHVSDIHLGPVVGRKRAGRIAKKIGKVKPDIVLSTGDFIDARADYLGGMESIFRRIDPPMGKFAVVGNHEVSAGLQGSLRFMKEAGFRVVRNESVVVDDALCLAGVDDDAVFAKGNRNRATVVPKNERPDLYTIFMKHRPPAGDGRVGGGFDLQLSGHTHGGQMFPFSVVSMGHYPKLKGMHELGGGALLYVNPGVGTWGPPMRFLTPPEITVIELVRPSSGCGS